jgi:hypothetical protein
MGGTAPFTLVGLAKARKVKTYYENALSKKQEATSQACVAILDLTGCGGGGVRILPNVRSIQTGTPDYNSSINSYFRFTLKFFFFLFCP